MAISDKLWDALTTVIKMNDKIVGLSDQVQTQQHKIEDLTGRIIRLETALEIALRSRATKTIGKG
jgi:archaellum component FlaC